MEFADDIGHILNEREDISVDMAEHDSKIRREYGPGGESLVS